jgi:hypothetical protein
MRKNNISAKQTQRFTALLCLLLLLNSLPVASQWNAANQTPVCWQDRQTQLKPAISPGPNYSTATAWADYRNTVNTFTDRRIDVYAQLLDSNGVTRWSFNGSPVSVDTLITQSFSIVNSGTDYYFGLNKAYSTNNPDSLRFTNFLQKLDNNGNRTLGAAGKKMVTVPATWQTQPALLPYGSGGIVAAWTDNRVTNLPVQASFFKTNGYVQRYAANGTEWWPANGLRVSDLNSRRQSALLPVDDGNGGVFVAYADADTALTAATDVMIQRFTAGGTRLLANGVAITPAAKAQLPLAVVPAKPNDCFVYYSESSNIGAAANLWLRINRIDTNGNRLWAPDGLFPFLPDPVYKMDYAMSCSDASGGIIVMAVDMNNEVWLQRLDAAGNKLWGAGGTKVNAGISQMRSDGRGGAVLIFSKNDNITGQDVYAARVNALGILKGNSGGMPVCAKRAGQTEPVLWVHDTARIVSAWQDERNEIFVTIGGIQVSIGNDPDIYATRFSTADIDAYTPTPVITVNRQPGNTITVYPNPAGQQCQLKFSLAKKLKNMEANLFTASGAFAGRLLAKSLLAEGVHEFTLPLPALQTGNYWLVISSDGSRMQPVQLVVKGR